MTAAERLDEASTQSVTMTDPEGPRAYSESHLDAKKPLLNRGFSRNLLCKVPWVLMDSTAVSALQGQRDVRSTVGFNDQEGPFEVDRFAAVLGPQNEVVRTNGRVGCHVQRHLHRLAVVGR